MQLGNKINHLEKKIDRGDVKENHGEFIKNSIPILKTQQRFKSERHSVLSEEIDKVALSSNDDKRMQSIHSIKTYAYGFTEW